MNFDTLFDPTSVAIFGARPEKDRVGYALVENLLKGKARDLYPITEKFTEILELPCYKSLMEIDKPIDLAIIAIRATDVPNTLRDCAIKGIKNVIIISAGFKEAGHEGARLEKEIADIAKENNIQLLGPNCLGVINTKSDLNASFIAQKPLRGHISILSQSGAIGTSFLDWATDEGVGVAKFVSLGNEAGFPEVAMLEYLGNDEETSAILMYLEHISDGKKFLELAREITKRKPVVVLRAGRSTRGMAAVMSHTGSLAPEDAVFAAAAGQAGIVTVTSLREFFNIAKLFTLGITKPLSRLAILTNGGGPSVNAADLVELSHSLQLATFDDATKDALREVLPGMAAVGNPVDVIGDAGAARYESALDILIPRDNIDAIIVIVTPQMMTDSAAIARTVASRAKSKPLILVLMGGTSVEPGIQVLRESGMVNFDLPPDAIESLDALGGGHEKIPPLPTKHAFASSVMLGFDETEILLSQYEIPIFGTFVRKQEEIDTIWSTFTGAIAMKVISKDVIHKTDLSAVRLNIESPAEAKQVWNEIVASIHVKLPNAMIDGMLLQPMVRGKEVIIGAKRDATFGPIVVFGLGGIFVEALKDVAMLVAPIEHMEAKTMIEHIAGANYLKAFRGAKPVAIDDLANTIVSISHLVNEHPEISEIDLNPVIATPEGVYIVDARLMHG